MQIFANAECTEYADGSQSPIYARVNVPWGFNESWNTSGSADQQLILCDGPSDEDPEWPYNIEVWGAFVSSSSNVPYNNGQVVELTADSEMIPITNPTVIFTKP